MALPIKDTVDDIMLSRGWKNSDLATAVRAKWDLDEDSVTPEQIYEWRTFEHKAMADLTIACLIILGLIDHCIDPRKLGLGRKVKI
jgi:hypothetical protein